MSEPTAHTARVTPERLIEVTIGLWPDDDPPGKRPPNLAAAIVKALRDEGYVIVDA